MTELRRRLPDRGADRGVSLVELLVASVVLLLVLPVAGGLLHSAVVAQRDIGSLTQANTVAQAVASSVEAGVRNSAAVRLTASGTGGSDELLVSRVRMGTIGSNTWACRAWFYSAADDVLYTRNVPVTATTTAVTAPTAATLPEWAMLATAVLPRTSGGRMFAVSPDLRRVDLDVLVSTGTERRAAALSTSITRRPQARIGGTPCF